MRAIGTHSTPNRITVGIILAALIISAPLMMNIQTSFTLFVYPGIAMIFFLIAALGGVFVMERILFASKTEDS